MNANRCPPSRWHARSLPRFAGLVSYSVQFGINLETIPEEPRSRIQKTMRQISEVVDTVSASSAFWSSMKDSVLQIEVTGWRIGYRVETASRQILVIEAEELKR